MILAVPDDVADHPRLRSIRRDAGFSTGRTGLAPPKDYLWIEDEPGD
jgi:hypothetical protein